MRQSSIEFLRSVGRALAELEKASWANKTDADQADFDAAYKLLRLGILTRNGYDLAAPYSRRIVKTK